ncbi:hypothetical protein QJU43_00035 [Pasteurella atlantica]|uniref:hypothetical protein n=1 Tax=Pasteurellaceae TaxID=712 RepID=UPI00275B00DD|nr:hypothetical protein [Pasteurella atlantica]MDP8032873.1 hypothetical protein [Pasteurella atlantica]MDP8034621.1 hypothetical protein [Pasteurella atlantica]MDP8036571.1 hypothetical protein [Pasteurella atlantica]MDP8047107.1 hypothetical protein [Pasteurella atlantica]MDP8049060.1 hypothetical protein [Pasteurella atlantica]
MLFQTKLQNKKLGLSQNEQYFCVVSIEDQVICTKWYEKDSNRLLDILKREKSEICIIQSMSDRFIWRKYLFFPHYYNKAMIYRQIIEVLKQEVPVSIEEIYFDYQIALQESENIYRVIIYALIKNNETDFSLNKQMVLDSELYCYRRGIDYLVHQQLDNKGESSREDTYLFKNQLIQFKQTELFQISIEKLSQLTGYKRLLTIEKIQNLSQIEKEKIITLALPSDQKIIDPYLYIIALGACLWNGKV